jgi:hypothetical protein
LTDPVPVDSPGTVPPQAPPLSSRDHRAAVWLYFRFPLSLRHVGDLLAERGIGVSFQTVSEWVLKFSLEFARSLRPQSKGSFADKWYSDLGLISHIASFNNSRRH